MTQLLSIPYTFVLMNWAAVLGFYHFMKGSRDIWNEYRNSPRGAL
ncbi:MAG TPA: hypothetical protein VK210_05675 [Terriglobia bacterium]|nr:hypothetical protein [Terriglobia bacterium]